ncbi:uncharacterized protein LOC135319162 [Camelus dromedarius]|uniref:uncharacterized protein LOC135319162 n=1 Tax=Camelus dromedarius TaxID=9838 RepID=UPI0010EF6543
MQISSLQTSCFRCWSFRFLERGLEWWVQALSERGSGSHRPAPRAAGSPKVGRCGSYSCGCGRPQPGEKGLLEDMEASRTVESSEAAWVPFFSRPASSPDPLPKFSPLGTRGAIGSAPAHMAMQPARDPRKLSLAGLRVFQGPQTAESVTDSNPVPEPLMLLPVPHRRPGLRRALSLRQIPDDSYNPEILYVELWMLPVLFGPDGELMTALHRWFGVLLVVSAVPGCGVLIFIIGPPFYQHLTMLLIVAVSFQLRIRENRARARTRRLLNSARASGRSV